MILLDVVCLFVALVAVALAVVALVRARGADERAARAASEISRTSSTAQAAAAGVAHLEGQVSQARQDAASAAQQAARAAQAAAQASAAAAASRREAEVASDKADHAAVEAEHAIAEARTGSLATVLPGGAGAIAAPGVLPSAASGAASAGRATVQRAEDHDVAGSASGATERVVRVAWQLEKVRNSTWCLRNTGLAAAHDALLSEVTVPPKFVRPDEVIPRDVERGDVLQFRVLAARSAPPPRVRVTWREGEGSPAYSREFTVLAAS